MDILWQIKGKTKQKEVDLWRQLKIKAERNGHIVAAEKTQQKEVDMGGS
jgi:hypothetical protein